MHCIVLMHCTERLSLSGLMTLFMRPNQSRCCPLLPKYQTKIIIITILVIVLIIIIIITILVITLIIIISII